jgi:uncharacterized Zn finger protein (UPF0148 family)
MGRTKVYAETERQRHKRFEKQLEELRSGINNKLRYQKRKQQEQEAEEELRKYIEDHGTES